MRRHASLAVLLLLPLGGWLGACTSTSSAQPGAADGGGGGAEGGATTKPFVCATIFDCAGGCATGDDPCEQACLAQGSAEAQQATLALAKCFNDHTCSDAACLKANCQAEADACLAQGQTVGTPLGTGSAPPGSVPADLVGSWAHAAYGGTERFKLDADGTGYYQTSQTSTSSCAITQDTVWDGTAVVDATTITIYGTKVTNNRFECGQKSQTTSPPQTLHFTYTLDTATSTLSTVDSDCAAKYPDSPSSASLYCKTAFSRE